MKSHLAPLRFTPAYQTGFGVCAAKPPPRSPSPRSGLTLLEVLIGIAVIGILVAITAPAVMWSREASRRSQCLSHLKQMGVAINGFQASHGIYPPGANKKGYSLHVSILPEIDQAPLYEKLMASQGTQGSNLAASVLIPLYLCPSDPHSDMGAGDKTGMVATNYFGNYGTGIMRGGYNGVFGHGKRRWGNYPERPLRPRDILDGLSNTAVLCELLSGDGKFGRLRTNWNIDRRFNDPANFDAFAQYCKNWDPYGDRADGLHGDMWFRGRPWTWGDSGYTWYNHVLTPNQLSCFNKDLVQEGIYTATSLHRGGVNLLYADGRVEFISENIDGQVWTNLGSRGGK